MNDKPDFVPEYKGHCPVTSLPAFMEIEHPDFGMLMTYGGPYDSYTLPLCTDDGSVERDRFDHDEGGWLLDDHESLCCVDDLDRIREAVRALVDLRAELTRLRDTVDKLPTTADGVPVVPYRDHVWRFICAAARKMRIRLWRSPTNDDEQWQGVTEWSSGFGATFKIERRTYPLADCYSTKAAAAQARAEAGEGEGKT